jgi:hypothetical protein
VRNHDVTLSDEILDPTDEIIPGALPACQIPCQI